MASVDVKSVVKEKYGEAAKRAAVGETSCGCGGTKGGCGDPITSNLYDVEQIGSLPVEAVVASLGCGNPTALAELKAGETVLDLGSGGGIDVLLSARRVGPTGRAFGLDMTDEMLALARENQRKSGVPNVEFLRGEIEHIRCDHDGRAGTLAVQLVAQPFRFADRLVTMNADVGAVCVKAAGQRCADAPGSARDQDGAAGESISGVHVRHVR